MTTIIESAHHHALNPDQLSQGLQTSAMKGHLEFVQKILYSPALEGRFIVSQDTLVGAAATGNPNIVKLLGSHKGGNHPFDDTTLRRALV